MTTKSLLTTSLLATLFATFALGCSAAPAAEDTISATPCAGQTDCADGELCDADGTCSPGCASNADCAPDTACSPSGYCIRTDLSRPDNEKTCDAESICVSGEIALADQTPTVMLLVDQSSSMRTAFGDTTRWLALRDALVDPATGIIKNLEQQVRFGLAMYSGQPTAGAACPVLIGPDQIQIDVGNYAQIASVYASASPLRDTPTAESLAAVTDTLLALDVPGPKAIVLATDGHPDTCEDPNAHNQDSMDFVVATARASREAGVSTYVLSVGDELSEAHLQQLANAGAGVDSGAPYYQALDQVALRSALEEIVAGIRSCTLTLDGEVAESVRDQGTVTLDDEVLTQGQDWQLSSATEIQLIGQACETLRAGDHQVSASFPCPCDQDTEYTLLY